jgi:hypothetical protein
MEAVCISETPVCPQKTKKHDPSNFTVEAGSSNFRGNNEIILVL